MKRALLSSTAAFLLTTGVHAAIVVGQIDDFENGTTQSWTNGGPAADPLNITTGGPLGSNDNFLQVTADGGGAGGILIAFNRSQWIGNYISAGVTQVELDLKNFGSTPLTIRIGFKSAATQTASGYVSTTGFSLAADGAWHHATFLVSAAAMTGVNAPTAFSTFMTNPVEMRIFNASSPVLNGDFVVSQMGLDNIRAVPEPAAGAFAACAAAGFALRRRRSV